MSTLLFVAILLAAGPQNQAAPFPGINIAWQGNDSSADANNGGDDLAEVIEKTIAPNSWESMGGQGVIRYWRPLRSTAARTYYDTDSDRPMPNLLKQMGRLRRQQHQQ